MGLYTQITRRWLEQRFRRRTPEGIYIAHQPVFGVGHPASGLPGQLPCVLRILRILEQLQFGSFLDVGGAEGYMAWLVQRLFAAEAVSCDLSVEACARARELFALPTAAVDGSRLPFADGAFDVVLCSEVIEHVEHPVETMLELRRVAARAVILTTEELHLDRAAIAAYLFARPGWPHMERNRLHPDDLRAVFGDDVVLWPQADRVPVRQVADTQALRRLLLDGSTQDAVTERTFGVAALCLVDAAARRAPKRNREALVEALLAATIPATARRDCGKAIAPALLDRLRCPRTGSRLRLAGDRLVAEDGGSYPVLDGVPDLFPLDGVEPTRGATEQNVRRLFPGATARQQALLELRDRLFLPDRFPQDEFDFADRSQQRGFWANEQLVPRKADGPGFHWRAVGSDPWVVSPCLQRPVRKATFEMRIWNPDYPVDAPVAQIYWQEPHDHELGEDRCLTVRVPNDGKFHEVVFDLTQHPRPPGQVGWLRLDPADGPCEVDLRRLRLE